ncbi:MAG: porphobilinogen synthase [Candidatus Omnitrophota bacterium]
MRSKISEVDIDTLIYPLFVKRGSSIKEPIPSMPGVYRFSPDMVLAEVERARGSGIKKILLFGLPKDKDEYATAAYRDGNIVSKTVALIKEHIPDIQIMTDVCLCAYTTHGHCGILKSQQSGVRSPEKKHAGSGPRTPDSGLIDQETTLNLLAKTAVSHAAAGADYVAPSAMQRGQVGAIRSALDKNGYRDTKIMGYSAKFASQFYGPFRDVADSSPKFGDRMGYQLDYNDRESAFERIEKDIKEGADIVMIKPALAYLDIIREAKVFFRHPMAVYNVSGEYAMVKAGAKSGYWDEKKMVLEIIAGMRRAGADLIITYHAYDIARWSEKKKVLECSKA